nr:EOG090X07H9 [Lepidurus arcticus]
MATLGAWLVTETTEKTQKKKKRIVKHKKKAWRTTSDVQDVEAFLEEERLEQRLGAPFAERPSESLFVIDEKPQEFIVEPKSSTLPVSTRKRRHEKITLKCFAGLESKSAVPDPVKKRNRVRLPAERRNPLVVQKQRELREAGKIPQWAASYLEQSAKNKEFYANKKPSERLRNDFNFDLWGAKGEEVFEMIMSEMIQGLDEDTDEENVEDTDLVEPETLANKNERKTRQQRRKEKVMKSQEQLREKEKDEKQRMHDIYRLKTIKKEIKVWEKLQEEKLVKKKEKEVEKELLPRTLGRVKYEEPDLDLQLSEELCGSLRELKSEGDLLMDRYKSLQKRNFIEPRLRQRMKRKYRLKKFEKRSHKDAEEPKKYPQK